MKKIYKKFLKNEKGLTLIEIIIAISLLAIISIPFLSSFVFSAKVNSKTRDMNNATFLAQKTMEEVYTLSALKPVAPNEALSKLENTKRVLTDTLANDGLGFTIVANPGGDVYPLVFKKEINRQYVKITINDIAPVPFRKVFVEVYRDVGLTEKITQMENLIQW